MQKYVLITYCNFIYIFILYKKHVLFQFYVKSHTPSLASSQEESVAESLNLQIEALKEEFNAHIKDLMIKLDEEKRRNICLEEQIQYLTDLHQKVCNHVIM